MPRASKRKSDHETSSASAKTARVDSVRSATNKAIKKMQQVQSRTDELFKKYANKSSGIIDPEGIEALCSDLEVDYTDVRILMLAWRMRAEKQGYFTLDEWQTGLNILRVDTINKLKKALPALEKEVHKPENFDKFYNYAFRYSLTEEKQKCLDVETTCLLLDLVLGFRYRPQVDSFIEFLKIQSDYKVVNMDQWTNFLRFCEKIFRISFQDLENYDTCQAWPLILDNFVEWMKEKGTVTPA